MKVTILKAVAGKFGAFRKGQEAELPDEVALDLILHGIAEAIAEKQIAKAETATSRTTKKRNKR